MQRPQSELVGLQSLLGDIPSTPEADEEDEEDKEDHERDEEEEPLHLSSSQSSKRGVLQKHHPHQQRQQQQDRVRHAILVRSPNSEVRSVTERLHAAQGKVKMLQRLEAAIVDLFMEVLDRTSGADDQLAFEKTKRKETALRKAQGDALALLNSLRTQLRLQWAGQEETEKTNQATLTKLVTRSEIKETTHADEMRRLEQLLAMNQTKNVQLVDQIKAFEAENARLSTTCKQKLAKMAVDHQKLRVLYDKSSKALAQKHDENDKLSMALASEKHRVQTLEHSSSRGASGGDNSGNSTARMGSAGNQAANVAAMASSRLLRDYESKLCKLEATNAALKSEIERLQQQIVGFRHHAQAQNFCKMEKQVQKSKESLASLKDKLSDAESEGLRTRGLLKEKENLIEKMKDEYQKLFQLLQKKQQQQPQGQTTTASTANSTTSNGGNGGGGALPSGAGGLLKTARSQSTLAVPPAVGGTTTTTTTTTTTMNRAKSAKEVSLVDTTLSHSSAANDNPYLLAHYKAKLDDMHKQIESLQQQIRKMIAAEYTFKRQNRALQQEKRKLQETNLALRMEVDHHHAMLTSSGVASTASAAHSRRQNQLATPDERSDEDQDVPPGFGEGLDFDGEGKVLDEPSGSAVHDIRLLRKRNKYLEDRFREILSMPTMHQSSKQHHSSSEEVAEAAADQNHQRVLLQQLQQQQQQQQQQQHQHQQQGGADSPNSEEDDGWETAEQQERRQQRKRVTKRRPSTAEPSLASIVDQARTISTGSTNTSSVDNTSNGSVPVPVPVPVPAPDPSRVTKTAIGETPHLPRTNVAGAGAGTGTGAGSTSVDVQALQQMKQRSSGMLRPHSAVTKVPFNVGLPKTTVVTKSLL